MRFFKPKKVIFIPFRYIVGSILGLAAIVLIAQLILTTPDGRAVLSETENLEYTSVDAEGYESGLGEMTLKLNGIEPNQDIRVLQNGAVIGVFLDSEIKIVVSDNSLIEIDATKAQKAFSVEVTGTSQNIALRDAQSPLHLNQNIGILARIFIK